MKNKTLLMDYELCVMLVDQRSPAMLKELDLLIRNGCSVYITAPTYEALTLKYANTKLITVVKELAKRVHGIEPLTSTTPESMMYMSVKYGLPLTLNNLNQLRDVSIAYANKHTVLTHSAYTYEAYQGLEVVDLIALFHKE